MTSARLGTAVGERGELSSLEPADGDPFLWLRRTDDGPASCHPDLYVDVERAADRAVELGAARVEGRINQVVDRIVLRSETAEVLRHQAWGAQRVGNEPGWTVLRDRAGMPSCVAGRAPGDV